MVTSACPLSREDLTDIWGHVYRLNTDGDDNSIGCWLSNVVWMSMTLWGFFHVKAAKITDENVKTMQFQWLVTWIFWAWSILSAIIFHMKFVGTDLHDVRIWPWNISMILLSFSGAFMVQASASVLKIANVGNGGIWSRAISVWSIMWSAITVAFGLSSVWIPWEDIFPFALIFVCNGFPLAAMIFVFIFSNFDARIENESTRSTRVWTRKSTTCKKTDSEGSCAKSKILGDAAEGAPEFAPKRRKSELSTEAESPTSPTGSSRRRKAGNSFCNIPAVDQGVASSFQPANTSRIGVHFMWGGSFYLCAIVGQYGGAILCSHDCPIHCPYAPYLNHNTAMHLLATVTMYFLGRGTREYLEQFV